MSPDNRFSNLEASRPLPDTVKAAIAGLSRFDHLEIGRLSETPARTDRRRVERRLCAQCGQANEMDRDICWACCKPLNIKASPKPDPEQEIHLLLNGVSYTSSDADLPADIRALMDRIRREGYSEALLKEWERQRQAAAPAPTPAEPPIPEYLHNRPRVEVIDGKYIDILRIDGVLYKSDDANLAPEIREIFAYIEQEGVTPALVQHLQLYGTKVRYRPLSSPKPSDDDRKFWQAANKQFQK